MPELPVQLAVREIRRAKLRFGLLGAAVGLLVFLILFQQALLNGLVTDFVGALENQDSPILVFNEQARANLEGSFLSPEQVDAVAGVDGVAASSPIGEGTFTVRAGEGTDEVDLQDATLFGHELGGLGRPTAIVEGRAAEAPFEAVASAADAGDGFGVGDVVTVVGEGGDVEVTVVGLAEESRWSVSPTLFVSLDTYETAVRAVNPQAPFVLPSVVAVRPADGQDAGDLTDRIDGAVPGVETFTQEEAVSGNPGVTSVSQSFNIILALAFIVVVVVVGFFFLILTVQKSGSLTLLRAIGAPSGYLVTNLLFQIAIVMLVGAAVGLLLTFLILRFGLSGDLAVSLSPTSIGVTILSVTLLAMVGGLAAIRRVLAIDPIEATVTSGVR